MRILHVDPAPTWRGGERQVLLLAAELARRGHESPVIAAPGSPLLERARAAGLPAEPLAIRGAREPAAVRRLADRLRALAPDVLHLHTSRAHGAGGLAARIVRRRAVVVTRRLELPIRGPFARWKYRNLADHYVAISGAVAQALRGGGVASERITIVPSALEPPPETTPREAPPAGGPFRIGTVAAFTAQKDPRTWARVAIRVMREDPTIRFAWAGDGELASGPKVAMREVGLEERVEFFGFLADLEDFWRGIDLFFLPSVFEALGPVLLDALARGIPVVATRVGGIPETVRNDREGLLASVGDEEGLAAAILAIRRDADLHRRLGRAGRERSRKYAVEGIVDRIETVYEDLVSRRKEGVGR